MLCMRYGLDYVKSVYKLDGCIRFEAVRYICAQAVYFLHSTMPSVTCLRLSDVSVICRISFFSFQFRSAFLPCRSARPHSGVLCLANVGHRTLPKIWVGFLYGACILANDLELVLTVTNGN